MILKNIKTFDVPNIPPGIQKDQTKDLIPETSSGMKSYLSPDEPVSWQSMSF